MALEIEKGASHTGGDQASAQDDARPNSAGTRVFIGRNARNQHRRPAAMGAGDGLAGSIGGEFEVAGAMAAGTFHKIAVGHVSGGICYKSASG
jgi:hypothetical protein